MMSLGRRACTEVGTLGDWATVQVKVRFYGPRRDQNKDARACSDMKSRDHHITVRRCINRHHHHHCCKDSFLREHTRIPKPRCGPNPQKCCAAQPCGTSHRGHLWCRDRRLSISTHTHTAPLLSLTGLGHSQDDDKRKRNTEERHCLNQKRSHISRGHQVSLQHRRCVTRYGASATMRARAMVVV